MQSITSNFEKQEYEIFRRFLWLVHVPFAYIYRVLTTVRVYRIIFSHQQLYRSIPFDLPPTVILRFPTYKHLRIREYPRNSKDARKDFFRGRFIGRTLRSIFNCAHFSNSLFPPILLSSSPSLFSVSTLLTFLNIATPVLIPFSPYYFYYNCPLYRFSRNYISTFV